MTESVLRLAGAPLDARAEVLAAILDAGPDAAACLSTAAALHGFAGFDLRPIHVVRRNGGDHPDDVGTTHRSRRLPAHHVVDVDGIPTTTVARTLADLSTIRVGMPTTRLEWLTSDAVARRQVSVPELRRMVDDVCGRGRAGSARFRQIVETFEADDQPPAESGAEIRFLELVAELGLPAPARQVTFFDDRGLIGRVDAWWAGPRIAAEVDGRLGHAGPYWRRKDQVRDERLLAAGVAEIVRVPALDVFHAPRRVAQQLLGAFTASGAA